MADAPTATVRLEWPLAKWPNPNRSRRQHWAKNADHARAIRTTAKIMGLQAMFKVAPLQPPVHLHLAFAFPDGRSRDLLNVDTKALVDGIVDSGLVADDDWKHVPRVTITHNPERSPKGKPRVTVTLTEINEREAA